jgi:hypothetical protein
MIHQLTRQRVNLNPEGPLSRGDYSLTLKEEIVERMGLSEKYVAREVTRRSAKLSRVGERGVCIRGCWGIVADATRIKSGVILPWVQTHGKR